MSHPDQTPHDGYLTDEEVFEMLADATRNERLMTARDVFQLATIISSECR